MKLSLLKNVICQGGCHFYSAGTFWRTFASLFLISFLFPSQGVSSIKDVRPCLTQHLREAIDLNKHRAPIYEKLSQGRSRGISEKMIRSERQIMLVAPLADGWAAPFQRVGIPILCEDFVDMSLTPPFKGYNPEGPDSLSNFHPPDVTAIKNRLLDFYKSHAYEAMALYADEQVRALENGPRYNCMVRHVLESVRRVSTLAPRHDRLAQQRTKRSTLSLSRIVLKSHISALDESSEMDLLAAPLQAEALPIICQDVPHIPWP